MASLTKEEFIQQLKAICPVTDTAADMWCQWCRDLEDMDRGGEILPDGEYKSEAVFRAELIKMFTEVRVRFGDEVVGQVVALGNIPHCLFPWEIIPAGEHLQEGGKFSEVENMSIEGSLDGIEEYLEMKL